MSQIKSPGVARSSHESWSYHRGAGLLVLDTQHWCAPRTWVAKEKERCVKGENSTCKKPEQQAWAMDDVGPGCLQILK